MSHHFERLEEIKATRDRLKKSNSQEAHDRYSMIDPQLGNINEFNELTLALVNPGTLIAKPAFNLSKSVAKGGLRLIRNVVNRGKKALNTRAGKLVQKHADDAAAVYSIGNQTK